MQKYRKVMRRSFRRKIHETKRRYFPLHANAHRCYATPLAKHVALFVWVPCWADPRRRSFSCVVLLRRPAENPTVAAVERTSRNTGVKVKVARWERSLRSSARVGALTRRRARLRLDLGQGVWRDLENLISIKSSVTISVIYSEVVFGPHRTSSLTAMFSTRWVQTHGGGRRPAGCSRLAVACYISVHVAESPPPLPRALSNRLCFFLFPVWRRRKLSNICANAALHLKTSHAAAKKSTHGEEKKNDMGTTRHTHTHTHTLTHTWPLHFEVRGEATCQLVSGGMLMQKHERQH